jgi:hypothetical protein
MASPQPQIRETRTFVAKPISLAYLPPAGVSTRAQGALTVAEQVRPAAHVLSPRLAREHSAQSALGGSCHGVAGLLARQ